MSDSTASSASRSFAILGLLLALGLVLGGFLLGQGIFKARVADRFVTVRGLAEREVRADLAIWPIVYTASANDLSTLQQRVESDAETIAAFLAERGFSSETLSTSPPRITDFWAQGRHQNSPSERYQAEATVTVRTDRIDEVLNSMQESGELVRRGVTMIRSYEYQTQFLFTALDSIKPEMIAEATRDARRAAQQFAEDSGSEVGSIRKATQGYFSINDRDPYSKDYKKVRVVTTVEYFLAGE